MTSTQLAFSRVSEQPPAETEKCLLYAGSGVGKTALFGTLGSRSLFIDTGKGLETLKSPWFKKWSPDCDPITIQIIEHINARGEVTEAVAYDMTCDAIDQAVKEFGDEFDNIIVDDASALRDFAMNKSIEYAIGTGISKIKYKEVKKASDKPEALDKIIHEVAEWQGEMNLMDKFIRGTIDVCESNKKNLWMGAHERFVFKIPKDERTGKMIIGAPPEPIMCYPSFTGKQIDNYTRPWDDVWHLEQEGDERKLRLKRATTAKYGDVVAKTRHDGVFTNQKGESADFVRSPNLSKMLTQIKSAWEKP